MADAAVETPLSPPSRAPSSPLVITSNADQEAALAKLREKITKELFTEGVKPGKFGAIPKELEAWCDDACLSRFLRANKWKYSNAFNQLYETLAWRRDFKVDELSPKSFEKQLRVGKIYTNGRDKAGRPILYTKKRTENTEAIDFDMQVKQLVYMMEKAIRRMPPELETWIFVFDLNGMSSSNSAPMSVTKKIMNILATCYPERLYKCFIVDAPKIFSGLWTCISPFIDPVTKAKVIFVDGPATPGSKKAKAFLEHIDADQLEKMYGGNLDYEYNFDKEDAQYEKLTDIKFMYDM